MTEGQDLDQGHGQGHLPDHPQGHHHLGDNLHPHHREEDGTTVEVGPDQGKNVTYFQAACSYTVFTGNC